MTIARFAWRQVWKGAVIWAVVSAVVVSAGVRLFNTTYGTPLAREAFAHSIARLPSFQALYGRAVGVDTVGGFLTWRYAMFMTLVVSLWAMLAVTRILRGDEETQRAEVLVSGRLSARRLVIAELTIVLAGCGLLMVLVALACMANGLAPGGSLLFGFLAASGGLVFGAVGAFTSQLFDTRRRAAGWAGTVIGASYLLRALADGSSRLHWVGWLSPFGWAERIEPFTGATWLPIVIIAGTTGLFVGATVALRDHRDTGAGLIGDRVGRGRLRAVGSVLVVDWYLSARGLMAWAAGIFVGMFVLGYLTKDVLVFASDNPALDRTMVKEFGYSLTAPTGYVAIAFGFVATLLAVYAGTHMMSAREDEAAGRADTLLVMGSSRVRWLVSRLTIAFGAMLVLALAGAAGTWAGANVSGAAVGVLDAVKGSLNVVPAALLFSGLAVLAFGAVPRATAYTAFGTVTVAYVIQIVGGLAGAPAWLTDVSPFAHIAAVPAVPVNVAATLVMLAIAAGTTALGVVAFHRRDVAGD